MSTNATSPTPSNPTAYTGTDRYVRVAEDLLGVTLTAQQKRIHRAVADHRRVLVEAGNGPGKSFAVAALNGGFLLRHPDSINIATSGTYSQLEDVLAKPLQRLWRRNDLPGDCLSSPPRVRVDGEWYWKATSPRNPGDLEGRHAGEMLVTIEEADKPAITAEHIESAESMLTGERDRMVVVANPPRDETNVVADLRDADHWHHVHLSTLHSHNVRVDAGEVDADRIPGITGLQTVKEDWKRWHNRSWPGLEAARTAHEDYDDLDERWYRRRAGVMPPGDAAVHRPLAPQLVDAAYDPDATPRRDTPQALGVDVARSGDDTVAVGPHDDHLVVEYERQGADHTMQEQQLAGRIRDWPTPPIAVDAVGEGSGLADGLDSRFGTVHRFKNQATAVRDKTYDDKWAESLALFADYLRAGGTIAHQDLYEQAKVAARTVAWEERHIASRGRDGADVLAATATKEDVKQRVGRSPDHLDAALMAVWIDETDPTDQDDRATFASF